MLELLIRGFPLPEVYLVECPCSTDIRGNFTKFFHADSLLAQGINLTPAECFLTRSKANVLRGMHFQVGKAAQQKLVMCIKGRVLDVVVDVRADSPYFNKPYAVELSEANKIALLIGKGYAHGFLSLSDDSWMLYSTSTVHCPPMDRGVLWSSIAYDWPIANPCISKRDESHPSILEITNTIWQTE
jgi:dTDP-4-dehydrorhamnose 3,5-epimerase